MNANAGNGTGLSNGINSTVTDSANKATSDLAQTQADYMSQFNNIPDFNSTQNTIDSTVGNPAGVSSADTQNTINAANGNYTYGTNGATSPATIQNVNNAGGGNDWGTTQADYSTAADQLGETQTEAGRDSLLAGQFGQNGQQYGSGEQNFDQLLLQSTPGSLSQLNATYNQYAPGIVPTSATAGQSGDLVNAGVAAQNTATNDASQIANIKNYANDAISGQINSDTSGISDAVNAANAARTTDYTQLVSDFHNNTPTAAEIAQVNATLPPSQQLTLGESTDGVDLSQFLGAQGANLSTDQYEDTTTGNGAADYAKAAALAKLAAGQSYASTANLGLGAGPDTTGGQPLTSFNFGGATQAINAGSAAVAQADTQDSKAIYSALGQDANLRGLAGAPGPNAPMSQQIAFWQPILNDPTTMNEIDTGVNVPWWSQIQAVLNNYAATQNLNSGTFGGPTVGAGPGPGTMGGPRK